MRPLLLLLCCMAALAAEPPLVLRLCTFDKPFPPYTMPDGSGQVQELLRRAAKSVGVVMDNFTAPRPRCLDNLRSGKADGLVAAFLPERLEFGLYPMQEQAQQADPNRALAVTRFLVFTRRGGALQWDGSRFSGVDKPLVAVQSGFIHVRLLQNLGVSVDDGGRTTEQNLGKLALDRVQAVVAQENDARQVLASRYQHDIDIQPVPFQLTPLYLLVSRVYYAAHKQKVDALWAAIRKTRESPAYQQYLNQRR